MNGIPEYGTGRHEDYLTRQDEERAAISAPAREFTAWADARCIERGDLYGWATMADAFAAGMQAQRNLDAAPEPKPAPEAVNVNDLPVTPGAAALYKLASRWWNEAFRLGRLLDQKHPRALALEDCSTALRAAVNDLRRDGDL